MFHLITMTAHPTEEEILATLTAIIADALRVDRGEITLESRLFKDLDAESIDIVDIRFRIEEAYRLKINQQDLMRSLGENHDADEIAERLTTRALDLYRKKILERAQASRRLAQEI